MRETILLFVGAGLVCLAGKAAERIFVPPESEALAPPIQLACARPAVRRPAAGAEEYRLAVSLPQPIFYQDDMIPFQLEFRNVSGREVTIWECGFWANHLIEVKDASGKVVPLTDQGKLYRGYFAPDGARDKNQSVKLNPGQVHDCGTAMADLSQLFRLEPGIYQVEVTHEEAHGPTPLRIVSEPVEFVVL